MVRPIPPLAHFSARRDRLITAPKMLCILTAGASLAAFVGQPFGTSSVSHSRTAPQAAVMMAGMPLPAGSLVALTTPMKENGDVDIPTLRKLLQWHKKEGTNGIVILGTTGEASCLNDDEKAEIMAVTREEVGGELPIVVGTGTISTPATIAATKKAQLFGADAALIVTPYYVKPSQVCLSSAPPPPPQLHSSSAHRRRAAASLPRCHTAAPPHHRTAAPPRPAGGSAQPLHADRRRRRHPDRPLQRARPHRHPSWDEEAALAFPGSGIAPPLSHPPCPPPKAQGAPAHPRALPPRPQPRPRPRPKTPTPSPTPTTDPDLGQASTCQWRRPSPSRATR